MSKPSLSELPLYDVPGASIDLGGGGMPPLTPLASLAGGMAPGALPLLVQMPDGETRQVALPPSATVGDLRAELGAKDDWVLGFNGELLDANEALGRYNIPDAYDHAGGLLKMIDTSELGLGDKVDALDKACRVVHGISRGERDMDRIISAALDGEESVGVKGATSKGGGTVDGAGGGGDGSGEGQPSLRALRSVRRAVGGAAGDGGGGGISALPGMSGSLPHLSFSSLLPPGFSQGGGGVGAPPTPSDVIRRLGSTYPNLYPPHAADKMMADLRAGGSARGGVDGQGAVVGAAGRLVAAASAREGGAGAGRDGAAGAGGAGGEDGPGIGALKRGATWFEDVMKSLVPSGGRGSKGGDRYGPSALKQENQGDEDIGASSGEEHGGGGGGNDEQRGGSDGHGHSDVDSEETAGGHGAGEQGVLDGRGGGGESVTDGGSGEERSGGDRGGGGGGGDCATSGISSAAGGGGGSGSGGDDKMPKKRGRKRKNPELSEDQRKALRQAQNRESAKQSRLRRKTIAAEYEQRVTTLSSENESLRDTISALSDRLQFLQGLLTVSVTERRPGGAMRPGPSLPPPPVMSVAQAQQQSMLGMPMIGGIMGMPVSDPSAAAAAAAAAAGSAAQRIGPQHRGYVPGIPPSL